MSQVAGNGLRSTLSIVQGGKSSCPKCGGGLESDVDVDAGPYKTCFTCGGTYFDKAQSSVPTSIPPGRPGRRRSLSEEDVHDVEQALKLGTPLLRLADEYGTSWATIYKIKSGRYLPRSTGDS
jgi:DnaJ-class molecular chaperone